jgi:hypothetical protein
VTGKQIKHAGDLGAARGGGAIGAAVKLAYTLCTTGETSGRAYGIAEADWNSYVRIDAAGGNYAPRTLNRPSWFRRVCVFLTRHKHSVAVLRPIELAPPGAATQPQKEEVMEFENRKVAEAVANAIERYVAAHHRAGSPLAPDCPTGPECGPGDRPPPIDAPSNGYFP